jgi:tetratricopeptide (TPR) repeat protein
MARRHFAAYGCLALTGAAWYLARREVLAASGEGFVSALNNPLVIETSGVRRLTAVALTGDYILQALLPLHLCADYGFRSIQPQGSFLDGAVLRALMLVAGLLGLAWVAAGRRRAICFGALLFLVAVFPLTNAVFPVGAARADRFLYVPLLGLSLVTASVVELTAERLTTRRSEAARVARLAGLAVPTLLLAAITVGRNPDWHTARALWRQTVNVKPENAKARYNLALELLQPGTGAPQEVLMEAAGHLETAVSITRDLPGDEFFEPYINLGNVYLALAAAEARAGRPADVSRAWLRRAAAILQEGEQRMNVHGRRRGSWEAALQLRTRALGDLRPEWGDAKLHLALASALDGLGRSVEAGAQLRKAVAVEPLNPSPYLRLALLYARAGSARDVEILLTIARRLPPPVGEDALVLAQLAAFLERRTPAAQAAATATRSPHPAPRGRGR